MSEAIQSGFKRLLDSTQAADPWPEIEASGYLELLRPDFDDGAFRLEDLLLLATEAGRRPSTPAILEAMIERRSAPNPTESTWLRLVTAGQMLGAMERVQALTIDYALTRRQFGRQIAGFQAVQHQIAVLAEEVAAATAAAHLAFSGPLESICARRASIAKLRAGHASQVVSEVAHAVHGAIGISDDYELHHYVARLRRWRRAWGGDLRCAEELGDWALSSSADLSTLIRTI